MKSKPLGIFLILMIHMTLIGQTNNLNIPSRPELNATINQNRYSRSHSNFQINPKELPGIYPNSPQFHSNMPCLKPGSGGKMLIQKPRTSSQYSLLIYDPYFRRNANGPAPLIVIDSAISNNGMKGIDVKDIKSINVISDKRATDKYGEKGKNGD